MKIFLLKLKCLWQRTDWDDETDLALLSGAKRILERKLNKVTE